MPVARPRPLVSAAALVTVALLAAPLAPCDAQSSSDVVPRDLAVALLGGDGVSGRSGAVQLRVGEAAPRLPASVLPDDGLLLGSATYPDRSTTVVVLVQRPDDALAAVEQRLTAAGWTLPPAWPRADALDREERGFVSAPRERNRPPGFCHGSEHLVPSVERWSGGRTLLRLHLSHAAEYSLCNPRDETHVRMLTAADSVVPILAVPSGTEVRMRSSGGGGDTRDVRVALRTALTVPELLEHFGAQMVAQRWTKAAEAAQPAVGTQLWRRLDGGGRLWFATLTVVDRPDGTGRDAALLMTRDR